MKTYLKKMLRHYHWALVNTKYKWGVDLYSDVIKLLKTNKLFTVIDVGANEGSFSEEILESLSVEKLYAIEPGLSAHEKLKNRFKNNLKVSCDRYAISENSGEAVLYTYPDSKKNTLHIQLRDLLRKGNRETENIQVLSLDEYVERKKIKAVDFLKIDVEGNELLVLKGAKGLLSALKVKLIFCEFHKIIQSENHASSNTDLASLVEFLEAYNIRFVALYTQGVHLYENLVTCNVLFAHSAILEYED